jgi:hypothetical protein
MGYAAFKIAVGGLPRSSHERYKLAYTKQSANRVDRRRTVTGDRLTVSERFRLRGFGLNTDVAHDHAQDVSLF